MHNAVDPQALMAEAQKLIEQAQQSLAMSKEARHALDDDRAEEWLAIAGRFREQELREFVSERVSAAQLEPGLPSAEIKPDPATRFARQIRGRRNIV